MRINSFNRPDVNPYNRQLSKAEQQPKQDRVDQVDISDTAKKMHKASRIETERKARVEQLRIQVQNDDYKIEPKKIAEEIIQFYRKK